MEVSKEDFRKMLLDDMRADAHEELNNYKLEYKLKTDYDYFREYHSDAYEDAISALQELKRLHNVYEYEWDIREIGDEL